jgi:uncharacterized membrane protein YfcA
MEPLDLSLWILVIFGAFTLGIAKGGVMGMNNITIALFALIFPAKLSIGIILLLLVVGDWGAFYFYRRHAVWKYLLPIIPWTVVGVLIGWQLLEILDGDEAARLIGICLLVLMGIHVIRQYVLGTDNASAKIPHTWWFIGIVGFLGGFTSTVANAAAPIMMLFFLSVGLPKLQFLGTGAWFFMFLNLFKIPFYISIDLITMETLLLDLKLMPVVIIGVILGRFIVLKIPQKGFEIFAITITILASIRLIF